MSEPKASGTKSSMVEQVAGLSMRMCVGHLADYGARRSRHDFTQRQLMTCLVLRAYLKTTYRGVLDLLQASAGLRECLGLTEKLPHYTTLQKFSARSNVLAIAQSMVSRIGEQAARTTDASAAAMDATGLARTTVSDYFCSRRGRHFRRWVKVSVVVLCGSLLPLALHVDLNPTHDTVHARSLLSQAKVVSQPQRLYADAGFDAEWIHQQCREQWGVESVIQPVQRRRDGTRGGKWRAKMSPEYLEKSGYGRRWAVESFFSALKRTMGSAVNARRANQMISEAALKVLAYTLRR
jgi:Transposase DDE domain